MKKLLIYSLLGLITVSAIVAIQVKTVKINKAEYIPYIEDSKNGFKVRQSDEQYTLIAQFKPAEYIVLKERNGIHQSVDEVKNLCEEFDNQLFFNFTVANKNHSFGLLGNKQSSPELFSEKQKHYNFNASDNFVLTYGKDTIQSNYVHLEQTIGIKPFTTFLLGFTKPYQKYPKKNLTLYFKEEFDEFATQQFIFKKRTLNKQPILKN